MHACKINFFFSSKELFLIYIYIYLFIFNFCKSIKALPWNLIFYWFNCLSCKMGFASLIFETRGKDSMLISKNPATKSLVSKCVLPSIFSF